MTPDVGPIVRRPAGFSCRCGRRSNTIPESTRVGENGVLPEMRRLLLRLLAGTLFLPIAIVLIVATARLLAALGDATGAATFDRIALLAGIVWVLFFVGLAIVLALDALDGHPPREDEEAE